ncbi:hypothetical protein GJ496_005963 [Pomphorhynchus laevis]|nr:hypothetical protein GJ496_005963 [Pomphorhynchus laevis]
MRLFLQMFEHGELVRELPIVQQMPVERRLQHAQQRRKQQLEFWRSQNREVFSGSEHIKLNNINAKLKFSDEVLLLDATQRSDVDEVKELLKRNVRPDIKNHDGFTALHQF